VKSVLPPAPQAYNRKRLVAKDFRCEGVYNRAENPSVTFCGEEPQRNKASRGLVYEHKEVAASQV